MLCLYLHVFHSVIISMLIDGTCSFGLSVLTEHHVCIGQVYWPSVHVRLGTKSH